MTDELTITPIPLEEQRLEGQKPDPEQTVAQEQAPKPRKANSRKKPKKERDILILEEAPIKGMSEKEMRKYIEDLRTQRDDFKMQSQMLDHNCKTAFGKARQMEQRLGNYKAKANAKLRFATQAVQTCYQSIVFAGSIEEEE